jgi:hypothetical protein
MLIDSPDLRNKVILITKNEEEYNDLKLLGLNVAFWTTEDGHQHTWSAIAQSELVFIDEFEFQMPQELRQIIKKGAIINLWHGKDGKESGYKYLEGCPQFGHYISVLDSIRSETRMLSPGKGEHDLSIKHNFPGATLLNLPDIGTWGIIDPKFEETFGVDQRALITINKLSEKDKILWCPTFRDQQIPDPYSELSFLELNNFCNYKNMHIFIKPHRHDTALARLDSSLSNIHFIEGSSDVYPLVKYFKIAISDYSSIAIDFMENGINTILFLFDHEKYTSFRKIRKLPNSNNIKRIFNQEKLQEILEEIIKSPPETTTLRNIENEKTEWLDFIRESIKPSKS